MQDVEEEAICINNLFWETPNYKMRKKNIVVVLTSRIFLNTEPTLICVVTAAKFIYYLYLRDTVSYSHSIMSCEKQGWQGICVRM